MSFGLKSQHDAIDEAISQAANAKIILFAAAANHGNRGPVAYPARDFRVFGVNASDGNGNPARFNPSHLGRPNFSILGMNVESTWPAFSNAAPEAFQKRGVRESKKFKGHSKCMSGTSVATPMAAALTASLFAYSLAHHIFHAKMTRYSGVQRVFEEMSKPSGKFDDIVPWERGFQRYYEKDRLSKYLVHILEVL